EKVEFRGQHHRQFRRLLPLDDAACVVAGLAVGIASAGAVAYEAARFDVLAIGEDRRQSVAGHRMTSLMRSVKKKGWALTRRALIRCCSMVAKASSIWRGVLA